MNAEVCLPGVYLASGLVSPNHAFCQVRRTFATDLGTHVAYLHIDMDPELVLGLHFNDGCSLPGQSYSCHGMVCVELNYFNSDIEAWINKITEDWTAWRVC